MFLVHLQIQSLEAGYRRDNTDSSIVKSENKNLKSQIGDTKGRLADLEREVKISWGIEIPDLVVVVSV